MKKAALFTALCLLTLLFSACSPKATQWYTVSLTHRDAESDASIPAEHVAVALTTDSPLGGMEMVFSVTGENPSATVSIYKAEKDYSTTLSGKAVRQETFENLTDKLLWQFRTLPAGDYLIVFSDLTDATLLRSVVPSEEANGKILNYRNGEISTDGTCVLILYFIPTNEIPQPGLNTFAYPVLEEAT